MKLLLEDITTHEMYETEVKTFAEASKTMLDVYFNVRNSSIHSAETGRLTISENEVYYVSFNGKVYNGKYWLDSQKDNIKCVYKPKLEDFAKKV